MEKQNLKVSKLLLKAILFSFVTVLVTTVVVFVAMLATPHTVYNELYHWMALNNYNPEVYYTQYYRQLSAIANKEDWLIVTPLAYLLGGFVFGLTLASKRTRVYGMKAAAITAASYAVVILVICFFSPLILQVVSAREGVDFQGSPIDWHYFVMGVVQTIYWTAVFVLGNSIGQFLRSSRTTARTPAAAIAG